MTVSYTQPIILLLMKSIFVVLLSVVALSNATFLRDLANVAYTKAEYSADCITGAAGFKVTLTAPASTTMPTDISGKFTKGTDELTTATCTVPASTTTNLCGSLNIPNGAGKGNYTFSIVSAKSEAHTITTAPPQLCYTGECPPALATSQAKTAKIEYDGDTATNFTISFAAAFTAKPTVNAGSVALTCTAAEDKKSVVCTSTKTALEGGKTDEPKTYDVTLTECSLPTGIVLSVSGASFYKLSGIVLAVLALLF